jgi:hypothetical protein
MLAIFGARPHAFRTTSSNCSAVKGFCKSVVLDGYGLHGHAGNECSAKNRRNVGNPTVRRTFGLLDLSEPISRAFLSIPNVIVRKRELISSSQI